jgi:AraC-like DNA-binding protein
MQDARTTSGTTLRFLSEALEALGADWRRILESCDIDPACVLDPEASISQASCDLVWKRASEATGDPCIGLHAGERIQPHAVNLFGYLMLSSATLGDGIRRVARYQSVLTGKPWLSIEEHASVVQIRVGVTHEDPDIEAIHAEYVAALVLQAMGWVCENEILPLEIRFAHSARGDPEEYRRVFGTRARFGADRSEVVLGPDVLDLPSRHANARFARLHEQFASELLAKQEDTSVAGRVRLLLAERLESGAPDRSFVAKSLGMSDRSLQRRLHDEGTSFRAVLDDWRRDLAREQLQTVGAPIAEVAYLTGFTEVSSFTRAVRRWFGCTPGQLRFDRATVQ